MPRESHNVEGPKALSLVGGPRQSLARGQNPYVYGRVINICLSTTDSLYQQYNVLEVIEFEPVQDRSIVDESGNKQKVYLPAYKFHPSVRTPVVNEIVPIYNAPNLLVQNQDTQFSEVFYYSDPIDLYTCVEHNAAPDQNTISNLNSLTSPKNKANSYSNSSKGLPGSGSGGTDTIKSSTDIVLGFYFQERGIKGLAPLEGDFKLQGRFGNSIRFGGTPSSQAGGHLPWKGQNIGSPVILMRNGQLKTDPKANIDAIFEDLNNDGSSFYLLSDQTVELVLGSDNFDSYGVTNDNSAISSQVILTSSPKQSIIQSANASDQSFTPVETTPAPVSQSSLQASSGPSASDNDLQYVPDNEDDLNFVQIGEDIPVPLTQGVVLNNFNKAYNFVPSVNGSSMSNTTLSSAPKVSVSSVNAITNFAGQVSSVPTITTNGKALVDLVALTEGTMGQGNFNGYDILVTGKLVPGYTMANATPQHPNIKIYVSDYGVYSSATGRYQFTISTWNLVMGQGTPISKFNQDYACWKNILNSANVPSLLIAKIDTDSGSFQQVINMMAAQWASLPVTNDPKGLYKQAGRFSFATLYAYYKQILSKYQ